MTSRRATDDRRGGGTPCCDLRAVVLFMRRVRAHNNSRRIMSISLTGGVTPSPQRILFFSLCFGDRRSLGRPMLNPFTPYTAYARVRALRVKRCAEHKQRNRDRRQNFQRFHFHRFVLRKISQLETQTDVCRGGFKKDLKSSSTIRPAFSILLSW